jgi:nucleoside-diphosphate-sugar epimerase
MTFGPFESSTHQTRLTVSLRFKNLFVRHRDVNSRLRPTQKLKIWLLQYIHVMSSNTIVTMVPCLFFIMCIMAMSSLGAAFAPPFVSSRTNTIKKASTSTALHMMAGGGRGFQKVFVAGASRGVGHAIVQRLSNDGIEVIALVRSKDASEELSKFNGVTAVMGDAFDYKTVENAMDGCDAAITTLGGAPEDDGKRIDYDGNSNVIEAAGILGVSRVILVTSIGCGDSKDAPPPPVYETLKDVLAAKERAENVLIKYYTQMDWTIIRPGGLKSEPATGKAILSEDKMAIGTIHREDLANLVVEALSSANTKRKILSAIDPSIESAANAEGRVVEEYVLA